jgi:hypothetical protein
LKRKLTRLARVLLTTLTVAGATALSVAIGHDGGLLGLLAGLVLAARVEG